MAPLAFYTGLDVFGSGAGIEILELEGKYIHTCRTIKSAENSWG
jgi:hypothetical protein